MFNFNDDLLGGDNVHANLLANAVRESGDHSAINSCEPRPAAEDCRRRLSVCTFLQGIACRTFTTRAASRR